MIKLSVATAVILAILAGLTFNAKNIRIQLNYISGRSFVEPKLANGRGVSRSSDMSMSNHDGDHDLVTSNCLAARKDTVHASLYRKLPKPYVNLGFPKMGTTSIHHYFECGGLISTHFGCGKRSKKCAVCTKESVQAGMPPLSRCGKADVYSQIDNGTYFPQIELLEEFVHGHPNATFFLTFRSMEKWYHSLTHWPPRKNGPHMDERFKRHNISGSPSNERKSNPEEFSEWYCRHVTRVRKIVAENPSHTLVEIDVEDPDIGQRMQGIFGIDKSCWGHTNVNAKIHPEVNRSEVIVSKHLIRREKVNDVDNYNEDDMNDGKTISASDNESANSFDSGDAEEEILLDEGYESNDANEVGHSQSAGMSNHDFVNPRCLQARNNAIPEHLFQNLPKPYINLGFPKMGTSSIHHYFECGGLVSTHFRCGKTISCSKCTRESVEAGLPPLSQCKEADVYAQMDDGKYFPQIELLEEFVHGYPNATFFLTFRSMEKWYHSLTHWPPRKNGPHMNDRFKKENITGSPSKEGKSNLKEFSEWYCRHVTRVRNTVAENPSHTLVEIDIEDHDIGHHMQDVFGIDKNCWGHANVNTKIHPEVNRSEVTVSKLFIRRKGKKKNRFHSKGAEKENSEEEEGGESHDDEDESALQLSDTSNNGIMIPDCLKARNDTVPVSFFQKLAKPYINLGFPKMGTSSLFKYFKCGGLVSSHFYCNKNTTCAKCKESCSRCAQNSVESGLPPLSQCGKYDVYTQLDNGGYFPQIELLEEFVHGYPNATFFLTFRNMEKWYSSISNWPVNRSPKLAERFKRMDITGSPPNEGESNPKEFSDWYCKHVKKVRKLVAQNPSRTLVEVDIEDPGTGQWLEDMFGIGESCWSVRNANAKINQNEGKRTKRKVRTEQHDRKRDRKKID